MLFLLPLDDGDENGFLTGSLTVEVALDATLLTAFPTELSGDDFGVLMPLLDEEVEEVLTGEIVGERPVVRFFPLSVISVFLLYAIVHLP